MNSQFTGSITLIIGPMFSGKTTELLRLYRRAKIAGNKCLLIKYKNDTRYDEREIATHDGRKTSIQNCDKVYVSDNLKELNEEHKHILEEYTHIFIDEVQFYPNSATICDEWANMGKQVYVSGLSGDFKRNIFGEIASLIPKAEKIIHLSAICPKTGREAAFTARSGCNSSSNSSIKNNNEDEQIEVIGGDELYTPVDRETYFMQ